MAETDPLYIADHPDHAAAVERHLDSFRDPGDRRPAPVAPDKSPVPAYSKEHPYWNADHPKHREAVNEVQAKFRAQARAEESQSTDGAARPGEVGAGGDDAEYDSYDVAELRRKSGMEPVRLAEPFQNRWSENDHGHFMTYVVQEAINPKLATRARDMYVEAVLTGADWLDAEAKFISDFTGKLSDKQMLKLLQFARQIHGRSLTA